MYSSLQSETRERVRQSILDAATRQLVEHGLSGLSLRRIATDVGCSTTVIYTLFGGKDGLVDALWLEGFERLFQVESAVADGEGGNDATRPLDRLAALARAYRRHAQENPDSYRVMFGGAIPGFRPSPTTLEQSRRPFGVLVAAVADCIAAGLFAGEPEPIANVLWSTVHGVVSLELAGSLSGEEADQVFAHATRAVATGLMTPAALAALAATTGAEKEG